MKTPKMALCLLLAFTMLLIPLAGCGQSSGGAETSPGGDVTSGDAEAPPADDASGDDALSGDSFSPSDGLDENGFWKGIKALDYVELFNYTGISIPGEAHQISDDQVQSAIDEVLANYQGESTQITDRAVADGDTVNIDYVGSVDGVPFDGGSTDGAGTDVIAGSTNYIDDFLTQIIGHKPGETIDVEVTFPDDYQETSLQGKDAVFVTTINYISETEQPELTDEFVATNFSADYGWTTVAALREGKRAELQKASIEGYVRGYLADTATVSSVPDLLTAYTEKSMMDYYQGYADSYGVGLDEFLSSYVGVASQDELIENNRASNLETATYYLVSQAIAEDMGYSVSEDDMTRFFTEQTGTSDYSSYEEQLGLPYLKQTVLCYTILGYIVENAVLA
ncbi:MAG: FKBP-type peptidyl-prolyl cis-trans isomerase [Oscillospiraceae bacterium]|nr:FKBP-type peptidyl-prolyl cis-trans isomerase [Oscillospiraceae bacterium]